MEMLLTPEQEKYAIEHLNWCAKMHFCADAIPEYSSLANLEAQLCAMATVQGAIASSRMDQEEFMADHGIPFHSLVTREMALQAKRYTNALWLLDFLREGIEEALDAVQPSLPYPIGDGWEA